MESPPKVPPAVVGLAPFKRTDGRGFEGGGSGWGAEPPEIGGGRGDGSSHRHAAALGALPPEGERERGVGLEAW